MQINRKKFFDEYKARIDETLEQSQVDGLEFLLGAFEREPKWKDVRHVAYALATVGHECAWSWQPVEEGYYLGSAAKVRGFQKTLRYAPFYGRGYVQLTWKKNYLSAGKFLNIDLANNPELALDKNIAFSVMTWGMFGGRFTGKRLSDYINTGKTDYTNARRIINGTDKAALIAGYARTFEKILKNSLESDSSAKPPAVKPTENPPESETREQISSSSDLPQQTADAIQNNIESKAEEKAIEIAQGSEAVKIIAPEPTNFLGKLWKTILGIFGGTIVLPAFLENGLDWNAALQVILGLVRENFKFILFGAIVGLTVWYITKKINQFKVTKLVVDTNTDVSKKDVKIV